MTTIIQAVCRLLLLLLGTGGLAAVLAAPSGSGLLPDADNAPKPVLQLNSGGDHRVPLLPAQSAYCTADGASFATISHPAFAPNFVPQPGHFSKGFTKETCWLRFRLVRDAGAAAHWWLEINPPFLDHIEVYVQDETGNLLQSWRAGDRMPYSERALPHRRFLFPLHLPESRPVAIFVGVKTSSTLRIGAELLSPQGMLVEAERDVATYMSYAGFIVLSILINLILWRWLRQKVHALYAAYVLALLLLTLSAGGFLSSWLFPATPAVADRAVGVLFCATHLAGMLFFDYVLGLSRQVSWGRIPFTILMATFVTGMVAAALGQHGLTATAVQLAGLAVGFTIIIAGPLMIWHGHQGLTLYLAGFSFQLLGSLMISLSLLGWIVLPVGVDYINILTSLPHVILLNIALAYRLRDNERRRNELEIAAHRVQMENASLVQERQFMTMVSHEFRNPLAVIDTCAQRIIHNSAEQDPATRERCNNIREAATNMRLLMDEYLASERIGQSNAALRPEPCSPAALLEEIEREWQSTRLRCELGDLPETMVCDAGLLKIAISNLISNALRYSPAELPVVLSATVDADTDDILFRVRDQGCGLHEDEIGKIFEKYFRGRQAQTQTGAGLGLHLVDWIVRDHGGTIEVESRSGEGSCFCLRIPRTAAPSKDSTAAAEFD